MGEITRRDFVRGLAGLGAGVLCGRALVSGYGVRAGSPGATTDPLPHVREALYYTSVESSLDCQSCHSPVEPSRVLYCHTPHEGRFVRCHLCPKDCVISEGHRGDCRVRENREGKLYTMVYGNPCAVHVDPIEKKPFYHFLPTSAAFSIATAGCNLHCLYCQNWDISQRRPEETENYDLPPEDVVSYALQSESHSIAYTYSEPNVFYEYMLDTARLARLSGVMSVVISAGYINPAPLRELCRTVDAIKIDLKGFNQDFYKDVCFATLEPVLETIETIHAAGVHLEIVNLVVPTLNDAEDELRALARWIVDTVGTDVPTHFSRFYPQYKLENLPPTPVETVARARRMAMEEGIRYAYVGNVPGHEGNHTYCAACGEVIIRRRGFGVVEYHIDTQGRCQFCDNPIPGVWWTGERPPVMEDLGNVTGPADQ